MKVVCRIAILASVAALSAAVEYGPANCVTLSRSLAGSCVISTNCEAHIHELDHFEFVFDCESSKELDIVRHSFGVGGFDADEEFDTEVKCDTCSVPTPENLVHKKQPNAKQAKLAQPPALAKIAPTKAPRTYASLHNYEHTSAAKAERPKTLVGMYRAKQAKALTAASKSAAAQVKKLQEATAKVAEEADEKEAEEEEVVETRADSSKTARYGPNACVSTYRSKEGHCIMKTDCDGEDVKNYTFGLVCVDKVGAPVRHIFGKDSFDPEETFDTLISCEKCLGLDDIPESISLNSQVMQLTGAVAGLGDLLKNISKSVEKLNTQVFADKKVVDKKAADSDEGDAKAEEKAADDTETEQTSKDAGSDSDDSESDDKDAADSDEGAQADKQKAEEAKKAADAAEVAKENAPAAKEEAPAEEQEAPAAKQEDEAEPAAADDNSTGTDTAEQKPDEAKEELPAVVKFHGARRTHKHTRRAARHHKHTRSGSLRHEIRKHAHHVATAHHHQEPPAPKAVALAPKKAPPAPRVQPAAVVEANAGVGMKEQTRRLRASVNAERQHVAAVASSTDDEDDSDDSQEEADGDSDDAQPHFENTMQQQGDAPVQTLQSLDDSVQPVQIGSQPAEQQMPAAPYQEQADREQDDEGSFQRSDSEEPAEDRNGFDSGDKFN